MAVKRAVFLDKDGTLVDDVPYNIDPRRIRLAQGAGMALRRLLALGFRLFVVSNQSGVARGLFDEAALGPVRDRIAQLLAQDGVVLDGFYYCPHAPPRSGSLACSCRKPAPGMLLRAAHEHRLTLEHSWMVGDILDDVEAGRRAGCRTVLIDNGHETEWLPGPQRRPHRRAPDLPQAAAVIAHEAAYP